MVRIFCFLLIVISTVIDLSSIQDKLLIRPHQDTLSLTELLARTKEAAGGNGWDHIRSVHIRWEAQEGGLNGFVEEFNDVVRVRYMDKSDFGVRSGAYGFNGKIAWSQDSSGRSQIDEGADAREGAINEAFRRSLVYWYPERWRARVEYEGPRQDGELRFQVLRITPDGGRPFELWFDGTTYLLRRIVEKTSTGMVKVLLTDYQVKDKLQIPFTVRVQLSSGSENIYRAKRVDFNQTLSDSRFNIPPPPPPDFILAQNSSPVKLPFEFINNHIYIKAKLNEKGPFRFLLDTGWGTSSITPEVARILRLNVRGAQKTTGAGEGTAETGFTRVARIRFGGVQLINQAILVSSAFDGKTRDAVGNFGGLIGYELFKRFVVTMDFERKMVTLTLPSKFVKSRSGITIPFKLSSTIPLVRAEVDGVSGEFIVDSGFPGSVILYEAFVSKNDLTRKLNPRFETITGWGIGGPVRAAVTRARDFTIGEVTIHDLVFTLSLLKKGTLANPYWSGAIGSELLSRFTVTFDYDRREMILERNANFQGREIFDRSGMYVNKTGARFEVLDVVSRGPADEAGIKIGDRILSLDGINASRLTLPELRLRLKGPVESRVNVVVLRQGLTRQVVLVLRDLV